MDFIEQLRKNLLNGLPGKESHFDMAPTVRRLYVEAPDHARVACIMALFYPGHHASGDFSKKEDWNIVLVERQTHNKNDRHRGQISFPGGKLETTDPSLKFAALRETKEEVGVPMQDIEVLGELTELYIPVSNFKVYPFVGFSTHKPKFVPQESEVKSILEVSFSDFQNPKTRKIKDIQVGSGLTMREVPYFDIKNHVIWGATAMILNELRAVSPKMTTLT